MLGSQLAADHTLPCLRAEVRNARSIISTRDTPFNFEFLWVWATDNITLSVMSVSPWDLLRLNTLVRALFTRLNRSVNLPSLFLEFVAAEPSCLVPHFAGCTVLRNLGSCENMPCWDSVVGVVTVLRAGRSGVRFSAGETFSSLKGPDLL